MKVNLLRKDPSPIRDLIRTNFGELLEAETFY